jgi:gamma-glutamyltranspeptidase/glutathione hydrolase
MSKYTRSIAATGHELVSGAAAEIMRAGGNAFDAAVAAGFAGAVAEQTLTSLGGGGFLLARTAGEKGSNQEIFFDFFVDTPGLGRRQSIDPHFFPVTVDFGGSKQEFNIGMGSVAVPGILKGLLHVHERLGRMDLADVLLPAITLAKGHELNSFQSGFLQLLHPIMTMTEYGQRLYEPGGKYMQAHDILVNPDMAAFLEQLPEDLGESFYKGDIARRIDLDMREEHGLLTYEDLAGYRVIERKPLRASFRGRTLLTGPPPSMGGPLIALSLALLEDMDIPAVWGSGEYLLRTTGLMREVEWLRDQGVCTPETLAAYLADGRIIQSTERIRLFSRGTTHISIADHEGNVASMTCSNGEGSGYFAPGTGIMLNNMMGEDDLHPDGFHTSPAGERVGSMMSPSVLLKGDEVELVIGSGGSKRIRTAITQVLSQIVDFDRSPGIAVRSPRLHYDGKVLQVEPGFDDDALAAVKKKVAMNVWQERSMYFGGVHIVVPGELGVGDPRRGGSVAVVDV